MAFYPLERLVNLYEGYRQAFMIAGKPLLLLQEGGRTHLLINQCPHQQAPLTKASIEQGILQCPVHGIRFDLATGRAQAGCAQSLQYLPLAYEGNQVGVVFD